MTQRNIYFCRFAPNRFGILLVVGFVSLDAVGSHPAKRKSGACRGTPGLGAQAGLVFEETLADAKMLESEMPGPARRNPANPARSGRKQR